MTCDCWIAHNILEMRKLVKKCTMTGEATFTVVEPGETATVLRMVAPAGTLRTVPAEEGGIFCVAAAAAAKAAMPLI